MADGSIQFDTSLNPQGVIAGLESLAKDAKQATKAVSNALDAGILGGVEKIGLEAMSSMQTLAGAATAAAEEMVSASSLSEAEIARIRQQAQQNYLANLKKQGEDWEDLADREIRYLKNSLDLKLISETDYYRQLAVLRDQYFVQGSDEWERYTMEILEHNQKLVEEQKKLIGSIFEEMSEEIADNAQEIEKTQGKMAEKLSEFGGLYDNVTYKIGSEKGSFMRLHDMEADLAILQEYNDALVQLKTKADALWTTEGVPAEQAAQNAQIRKEFFSQIRDLSVMDGLNFANVFLNHPENEINSYLQSWAKKQALSDEISKNLYSEETEAFFEESVDSMGQKMIAKLEERFGALPENFFQEGVASALGFGAGFLEALDGVFLQLKEEIAAKTAELQIDKGDSGTQNTQNVSNYTIYGAESPYQTAMEIEKQEIMRRLLTGK